MQRSIPHPLEGQISDYLNGHLDATAQQAFEAAMDADPKLASLVRFDRTLRNELRDTRTVAVAGAGPSLSFAAVRERIEPRRAPVERPRSRGWLQWGLPLGAAAALVLLVALPTAQRSGIDVAPYETLTDPAASTAGSLTLIASAGVSVAALEAVAADAGLVIEARLPAVPAIRVTRPARGDIDALMARLRADQRVRLVQASAP